MRIKILGAITFLCRFRFGPLIIDLHGVISTGSIKSTKLTKSLQRRESREIKHYGFLLQFSPHWMRGRNDRTLDCIEQE